MNTSDFLDSLQGAIDGLDDVEINYETVLEDLEVWDSLAVLSVISMADVDFGVKITGEDVQNCKTIGDLASLVSNK